MQPPANPPTMPIRFPDAAFRDALRALAEQEGYPSLNSFIMRVLRDRLQEEGLYPPAPTQQQQP